LGGYVAGLVGYSVVVAVATVAAVLTGRTLPTCWRVQDLITVTLGTHKLSRTSSRAESADLTPKAVVCE
jgi:hypothetical protein